MLNIAMKNVQEFRPMKNVCFTGASGNVNHMAGGWPGQSAMYTNPVTGRPTR